MERIEKVHITGRNLYEKLKLASNKSYSFNRDVTIKTSCGYYCSLMQYAEPENKEYWRDVYKYIIKIL